MTAANPRSRASAARSIGKAAPASAAAPSGSTSAARGRVGEPLAVALQHEDVGQKVVGQHDGLRPLEVGVARHRRVDRLGRARQQRLPARRRNARRCAPPPRGDRAARRARSGRCASVRCAACRRPRPPALCRRRSTFMWMSSSSGRKAKVPPASSARTVSRPATIRSRSASVSRPARASARPTPCCPRCRGARAVDRTPASR